MGPSSVWRCSQSRRQIPRPSQRRKRLYTASQRPKSFGRSRQGSPVRARYSTASTNRRSLSTGGRPARDFKVARMGAISAHVLSVSSKRTDIKFSFLRNRYSGGNVAQIVNSSTRPSTTVVDRILSWFHTTSGGWNHGSKAGAVHGANRPGAGDGAGMDTLVDRGGTMAYATLSPPRSPSPRLGLYPRLAQPGGTQKRLAVGGSQWRCDALWRAAFVGACQVGCRGRPG